MDKFIKVGINMIVIGFFLSIVSVFVLDVKEALFIISPLLIMLFGGIVIGSAHCQKEKKLTVKVFAMSCFLISFSFLYVMLFLLSKEHGTILSESMDFIMFMISIFVMFLSLIYLLKSSKRARQFFYALLDTFF